MFQVQFEVNWRHHSTQQLAMFRKPGTEKAKAAGRLTELKNDTALFSRLHIASQTREGDIDGTRTSLLYRHSQLGVKCTKVTSITFWTASKEM